MGRHRNSAVSTKTFRRWLRPFPYGYYVDPVVGILTNPNVRAFVSTLSILECLPMTVMALRSLS